MKFLPSLLAAALLLTPSVPAQDATAQTSSPSGAAAEVPLIPEEIPQTKKPRGTAIGPESLTPKKSKTDVSIEELRDRVKFREAKTKALRDPKVQEWQQRAAVAKTDYERRESLKGFYQTLYGRMLRSDSSLKKLIEERQQMTIRRLSQARIDPTEPPQ